MNRNEEIIVRKSSRLIRTPTSDITFIVHPTEPIVMLGRNGESHTKLMRKIFPSATFRDITTALHGKMVEDQLLLQIEQSHLTRIPSERVSSVLTAIHDHLRDHGMENPRVIAFKDAIREGKQADLNVRLGTIKDVITRSNRKSGTRIGV